MANVTFIVVILNLLWFSAGFVYFSLRSRVAARGVVRRDAWASPEFDVIAGLLRFLGGLNLGFALLSLSILLTATGPVARPMLGVLIGVIAIAHASQFAVNVRPYLLGAEPGSHPWRVRHSRMMTIFVIDGLLALANAVLSLVLLA